MKTITNKFKFALVAIGMLAVGTVSAQETTTDITKKAAVTLGGTDGSVRVIDNKGTIKYLQTSNGLTTFTDTAPNGGIVTTWQLGGTLSADTDITTGDKEFKLTLNDGTNQGTFVISGIEVQSGTAATTSDDTGTGYTLLTRDEGTGLIKKLLVSDLVKGGINNGTATTGADFTYTDATIPNDITKIWVYRNGAKLLNGVDYTIAGAVGTVTVTVKNASGVDPEDYSFITGDRIEIQWVR